MAKVKQEKTTGERLAFKIDFMMLLMHSDRMKEASEMYTKIMAELAELK